MALLSQKKLNQETRAAPFSPHAIQSLPAVQISFGCWRKEPGWFKQHTLSPQCLKLRNPSLKGRASFLAGCCWFLQPWMEETALWSLLTKFFHRIRIVHSANISFHHLPKTKTHRSQPQIPSYQMSPTYEQGQANIYSECYLLKKVGSSYRVRRSFPFSGNIIKTSDLFAPHSAMWTGVSTLTQVSQALCGLSFNACKASPTPSSECISL